MVGPAPALPPKRPLMAPKTGMPPTSKVPTPTTTPKVLFAPKKATMEAMNAPYAQLKAPTPPKKAPLVLPKKATVKSSVMEAATAKPSTPLSRRTSDASMNGDRQPNVVKDHTAQLRKMGSSAQQAPDPQSFKSMLSSALVPSIDMAQLDGSNEVPVKPSANSVVASHPTGTTKVASATPESKSDNVSGTNQPPMSSGDKERHISKDVENGAKHVPSIKVDSPRTVGSTPWLDIERRINEIRALASANMPEESVQTPRRNAADGSSLYGNYNTHYESGQDWGKEASRPLSYRMVQSLHQSKDKTQQRCSTTTPDRWNFVDGFLKPRRKPFASMSELSQHFRHISTGDQSELIKLLLACRSLEKLIEEQHGVLDMLDHDLREAREMLRLPEHLRGLCSQKVMGQPPQEEPFYPTSDIPLFIKGRVSLLPGANDVQLNDATYSKTKLCVPSTVSYAKQIIHAKGIPPYGGLYAPETAIEYLRRRKLCPAYAFSRQIAEGLYKDDEVIEDVGQLLLDAINKKTAVDGAAKWFVDVAARDDTAEAVERLLCERVFANANVHAEALNFVGYPGHPYHYCSVQGRDFAVPERGVYEARVGRVHQVRPGPPVAPCPPVARAHRGAEAELLPALVGFRYWGI
ncbi:hypothetical protein, conserved [Babesia ovata]|uniref:Uncharacterized protein n=1 Tax=Babesia ovata TaxID=189622 RepID=A0A2H6KB24_9APIC|nr:uncharacterized protein BOVATA_016780 [Babesia ovata]GBE60185.1 hypothetical protein, conserved [Babesia ovata]